MVLQEHVQEHAAGAVEKFNAGETIIEHVSNSSLDHPLIQLPTVFGINFSVTKHVFMLWLVAATVFVVVTWTVRRYLKQGGLIPQRSDECARSRRRVRPGLDCAPQRRSQVGEHLDAAHPDVLLLHSLRERRGPDSDLRGRWACSIAGCCIRAEDSFAKRLLHGGTTATANFNVTAALATITFGAIIVAGTKAHGFVKHWKNLVPHGLAPVSM